MKDIESANTVTLTTSQTHSEDRSSPPPLPQFIPHASNEPPPVPSDVERSLLVVPGRKSLNSSSDAFAVMMRARQEKTKLPGRSALNKGKQRVDAGPMRLSSASTSSTKDWKPGRRHDGLKGSSNKLKSRMRAREKPKVEPMLDLSVPVETDPETDSQEIPDQTEINRDQEPISLAEQHCHSVPGLENEPRKTEVVIDTTNGGKPANVTPALFEDPLPVLPEEDTLHPVTGSSSSDALLEAPSADAIEMDPLESAPNMTTQEQGPSTIESTEMVYDQPACTLPQAEQHIDAVIIPASTRNGNKARVGRKKAPSTVVPVGRMTRSTASRLKAKEPKAARSGS